MLQLDTKADAVVHEHNLFLYLPWTQQKTVQTEKKLRTPSPGFQRDVHKLASQQSGPSLDRTGQNRTEWDRRGQDRTGQNRRERASCPREAVQTCHA